MHQTSMCLFFLALLLNIIIFILSCLFLSLPLRLSPYSSLKQTHAHNTNATFQWHPPKINISTHSLSIAKIRWVLLKFGKDLVLFCSDPVGYAQIRQRSNEKMQITIDWNLRQHLCWLQPTQPPTSRVWSNLICGISWLAVGLLSSNPMSLSPLRVGHIPDPGRPVNTPTCINSLIFSISQILFIF